MVKNIKAWNLTGSRHILTLTIFGVQLLLYLLKPSLYLFLQLVRKWRYSALNEAKGILIYLYDRILL
jgi:hypothetical protein